MESTHTANQKEKLVKAVAEPSNDDFRLLVDNIPDYAIYMLDLNGFVRTWNQGARRIKGYDADEIIGKHVSTFYLDDDKQNGKAEYELRVAREQGRFEEEGWRVRKDGTRFWANVILTPLIDDQGVHRGYGKVTRDLTERRRMEERIRFMIDNVKDYGIFMLDPDGVIKSWNTGAEKIQGYRSQEIIGKHFSTFYTQDDINRHHPQHELAKAVESGRYEEEGWRVRKDGTRFWANVIITPMFDDNGKLAGFTKVTRDLTQRKHAEEALKKAFEELESFSYSVSHDLRAPLRSMDGFSDILLRTAADKLDERSKSYLNRIRESSQRMAHLIDGLLDLSRLSRTPLSKQQIDLSLLANKVAIDLRKTEPLRKVNIDIQPNLKVNVDPVLFQVVMENLLGNAWKYTAKREQAEIKVGCEIRNGQPAYFVRDNGAGFDMEYAGKLFGAFQRLHGPEEFAGTGIGLATVKRIIYRHGGEISAHAKPGEGACFMFTLGEAADA